MAGMEGLEPPNAGTKNQCLTTWRRPIVGVCVIVSFCLNGKSFDLPLRSSSQCHKQSLFGSLVYAIGHVA